MLRIDDLRLDSDILPFFDYTDNPRAKQCLLGLLKIPLATTALLEERQQIIQGFINNWAVLGDFGYRTLDYQEVRQYFSSLSFEALPTGAAALRRVVRLHFSEAARRQLHSSQVQTVLFLEKLQRLYLRPLNKSVFPNDFTEQLRWALDFLRKLDLDSLLVKIRDDEFSTTQSLRFANLLNGLGEEACAKFWQFLALFEAYWSIARGMLKHGFTFPKVGGEDFRLEQFYHPAVAEVVKNSLLLLPHERVVVLTGPNMSGKSTLLKAIGLCVYLAHVGIGVPAARCEIPFFQTLVVVINSADNLQAGYSHFMTEIKTLKAVVEQARASRPCFALFDELFRGTNVDDALDITQTTLRGLTQFPHCFFFVSTHLLQLEKQQAIASDNIKKYHVECELVQESPVFSYVLREGWSALKIGRIIFDKEGLGHLLRPAEGNEIQPR